MEHGLVPAIYASGSGETFDGAGGDSMLIRLATAGPCPLTVVEDTSTDREWAPPHSHPWDELTYVLEGVMESASAPRPGPAAPAPWSASHAAYPISCESPAGRLAA
jgi:hypothetical protein